MFEEENDNKIYRLIITNGYDKNREYAKLPSKYILKLIFYGKNPFPGLIQQPIKNFLKK